MPKNNLLNDSKVFILLSKLDKKEFKDLGLWLQSPLHNSSDKVIKLYECFKTKYRNTDRLISEHTLLKSLGIRSSASKKKCISQEDKRVLQQTMYLLKSKIQDFLIWNSKEGDEMYAKHRIMNIFLERKMYSFIPLELGRAKSQLESSPIRDIEYCEDAFLLAEIEFYLDILLKNRNTDAELQCVIEQLRQFFIAKSLKYYCSAVNREKILKVKYQYPFLEYIKLHLENNTDDYEIPVIRAYYTLLKLFSEEKPEDYYDLKKYLFDHVSNFGLTDIRQFFSGMTNYCDWRIREGEYKFMQERYEVFKKGIELKCWLSQTYFSEHQFIHIVKTALYLGELDWLDKFFQEHKTLLNPKVQEDIVHYYDALTAFESKKYDMAQGHLRDISTKQDFAYYMESKVLRIKIYYDENNLTFDNMNMRSIENDIEAIKQYVAVKNNNKMSETVRRQYSNFANFFKRILTRKKKYLFENKITQANVATLQNDLTDLKPLIERTWLEEKITELLQEIK